MRWYSGSYAWSVSSWISIPGFVTGSIASDPTERPPSGHSISEPLQQEFRRPFRRAVRLDLWAHARRAAVRAVARQEQRQRRLDQVFPHLEQLLRQPNAARDDVVEEHGGLLGQRRTHLRLRADVARVAEAVYGRQVPHQVRHPGDPGGYFLPPQSLRRLLA